MDTFFLHRLLSVCSRIRCTGYTGMCFLSRIGFCLIGGLGRGLWKGIGISLHLLLGGEDVLGRKIVANDSSLALVEMKMLLREVYSRFRTTVASDMEGSMKLDDQIIASRPESQTCKLVFTPV
ncbi:Cytochrome P450 [Penicillium odoratum]|uniref:Cytochrome P450 n=1 Tax=Penicillium odoratum TaxID=1167516 RepID=UPI0025472C02|nr:Cytochrome P450 [Penicillium odoratum]KAJ5746642.1 Cytochrome P450 [Penicillium odoratum]